jgi:hypothetical protein
VSGPLPLSPARDPEPPAPTLCRASFPAVPSGLPASPSPLALLPSALRLRVVAPGSGRTARAHRGGVGSSAALGGRERKAEPGVSAAPWSRCHLGIPPQPRRPRSPEPAGGDLGRSGSEPGSSRRGYNALCRRPGALRLEPDDPFRGAVPSRALRPSDLLGSSGRGGRPRGLALSLWATKVHLLSS